MRPRSSAGCKKRAHPYRNAIRDAFDHLYALTARPRSSAGCKKRAHPYRNAIRDAFGNQVAHGVVHKTYSVTHLATPEASRRYSPAAVVAISHDVVSGIPAEQSYDQRDDRH